MFHLIVKFICVELFMVFAYYPFDVDRVCSDIACFIPETNSLLLYSCYFPLPLLLGLINFVFLFK